MNERATKVREPVSSTDAAKRLAESGRAVVREPSGGWSLIGTCGTVDRPRRERVLTATTFEDAVREACQ